MQFDAVGDRWIILQVFTTRDVLISVGCDPCLFCIGDDLAE